jgi:hypothetical protein
MMTWVCAIDLQGQVLRNRKLPRDTPEDLNRLVAELRALPAHVRIGIDVLGGIAALASPATTMPRARPCSIWPRRSASMPPMRGH